MTKQSFTFFMLPKLKGASLSQSSSSVELFGKKWFHLFKVEPFLFITMKGVHPVDMEMAPDLFTSMCGIRNYHTRMSVDPSW